MASKFSGPEEPSEVLPLRAVYSSHSSERLSVLLKAPFFISKPSRYAVEEKIEHVPRAA